MNAQATMSPVLDRKRTSPHEPPHIADRAPEPRPQLWISTGVVIAGLLLLDVLGGVAYAAAVFILAVGGLVLVPRMAKEREVRVSLDRGKFDRRDMIAIGLFYVGAVAFFRLAFSVFENNTAALFLSFAAGLILGVVGPIVYTVWVRERRLETLGLSLDHLPRTAALAVTFAAIQFALTLWGYELPAAKDWVPLLGMTLMVGIYEAIFFRGFVQGRLQESFGVGPAVLGAALLYSLYHVGYGMAAEEMAFLFGLGIVYALAYAAAENLLALWPLLIPLGSFYAQLEGGELEGELPWVSLAGFADVIVVFAVAIWLAHRHQRKLDSDRLAGMEGS